MDSIWSPIGLRSITFMGGGQLFLPCVMVAWKMGLAIDFFLSSRHAGEKIFGEQTLLERLEGFGRPMRIFGSKSEFEEALLPKASKGSLLVGIGPSWILPKRTIDCFDLGAVNINAIPIPHYLGGAHFTWQILNGSLSAGIVIQEMTEEIDRGDILFSKNFEIASTAKAPKDYFDAYESEIENFFKDFLDRAVQGISFSRTGWSEVENQRLYFPRLSTASQGFIDWAWELHDVVRFCKGFDNPYSGASTFLGSREVRLRDVSAYETEIQMNFHPFAAGLVVRRLQDHCLVAVKGGIISVGSAFDGSEKIELNEGDRLHTPQAALDSARAFSAKYD